MPSDYAEKMKCAWCGGVLTRRRVKLKISRVTKWFCSALCLEKWSEQETEE